ncbi:hypothetical protein HAP93_10930 [Acidithiobacillus ferriphilus]|uniref:type IV CRISPR-associated protein Csf3 n=1 Tax=Acidithiobacillus ferriphilus TaxID=1689834 RepID=UPI001C0642B9|nr:type IV CRISPR-associated protein Csf3 [Acidithiobacillus ferriphilus]MBU2786268.1 hypothetical protein [Acidithiobacillus ferriphilus]
MEAIEITFRLGSNILVDSEHPVHLDALVAYGVMREAEIQGCDDPWRAADDLSECLDRTDGDPWVWKASRLDMPARLSGMGVFQMTNMVRKSEPERFYDALDAGDWESQRQIRGSFTIDTQSGQYRGYQWYAISRSVPEVKAWAIGDYDALEYYLRHVTHIGKMGRNGYGNVTGIELAACVDTEAWRLRCLPTDMAGKPGVRYEAAYGCLRPPYWRKTRQEVVREPMV